MPQADTPPHPHSHHASRPTFRPGGVSISTTFHKQRTISRQNLKKVHNEAAKNLKKVYLCHNRNLKKV